MLWAMEEDQTIESGAGLLPEGIRPRDVSRQRSRAGRSGTMQERDVVGVETASVVNEDGAQRVTPDESEKGFGPAFLKMGRAVHGE